MIHILYWNYHNMKEKIRQEKTVIENEKKILEKC